MPDTVTVSTDGGTLPPELLDVASADDISHGDSAYGSVEIQEGELSAKVFSEGSSSWAHVAASESTGQRVTTSFDTTSANAFATTKTPDVPRQPNEQPKVKLPLMINTTVYQKLDNMFDMIRQERQSLLQGPTITIHIGGVMICGIFKKAAMAVSKVLNEHFTVNPSLNHFTFQHGEISPRAVRIILIDWTRAISRTFNAFQVPEQASFRFTVEILRAVRVLGMERYTKTTLALYINYFRTWIPAYDEIVIVEANRTSDRDPLWTSMINHLCYVRHRKLVPDPEHFAVFLELHPQVRQHMALTDKFFGHA